jgi:hypothetical protein
MSLLEKSKLFTKGSQNAFEDGDKVAGIALAITAAELLQIHRLLNPAESQAQLEGKE